MTTLNPIDFDQLFNQLAGIRVAVVGDVMLDTYWWGKVDRISPEAPVPVVSVVSREKRIGGAGNVALNIRAFKSDVQLISVLGDDDDGASLQNLLEEQEIGTAYLVKSKSRITTNKIRVIGRNQQMMRLDAEMTTALEPNDEEALLASFRNYVNKEQPHIVILEDYNKGVLTELVITNIIQYCRERNILTAVDPKRKNFFAYRDVDIFKPNLQEAREGLNILIEQVNTTILTSIHAALHEKLHHHISLITLSEKGIFYQMDQQMKIIPTHIRTIADVSGAGDTVIAVAALLYAATGEVRLMAEVANIAGGLVCEEVGTVAINAQKLLAECKCLLPVTKS
jgi:rfaE bifunctional protein kinase chain/domain